MTETQGYSYKESRSGWLSWLPQHWKEQRIKVLFRERDERSSTGNEELYSMSKEQGLVPRSSITDKEARADTLTGYKRFYANDIVMNKMQAWNGVFGYSVREHGIVSPEYTVLRPITPMSVRYYCDLFRTPQMAEVFSLLARGMGTAFLRLHTRDMGTVYVPAPPENEQHMIAAFLDRKTAQIDALIAAYERLLILLEEKRQAVITQAVTKGLDPTVPKKDSGVAWLGQVPQHWRLTRLKFLAQVRSGIAKGRAITEQPTMEMPYLRVANVQDGYLELKEVLTIAVTQDESVRYRLQQGDILMNEGGDNDKLGRGAVWTGEIDPCLHQNHVFAVRPKSTDYSEWINYFTCSTAAKSYFMQRAKQTTNLASVSSTNVKELPVPLAPLDEMLEIVKYLDNHMGTLDNAQTKVQSVIGVLSEYRAALVTAAVTGQIDVREEVAQDA